MLDEAVGDADAIAVSYSEGRTIGWLRLNRPETRNAVSPEMVAAFARALDELEAARIRVCIIAGDERAFSAGADLAALLEMSEDETRAYIDAGNDVMNRLETGPFITIAAVDGYALGGGTEIALACDLCIASPRARFGLPEPRVGTFPGWGGVPRLLRAAPRGAALDILLSGRMVDAHEALRIGIACGIAENVEEEAAERARLMTTAAPGAQRLIRELAREIEGLPLPAALERARQVWLGQIRSDERADGHRAFVEKRQPTWQEAPDA